MSAEELEQTENLRELFLNDVPLLDVRAPIEFADGAFPTAENHPLIDDLERHEIGLMYRHEGQDEAIELGHRLVRGERRQQRIARWHAFLQRHPDAALYCFRGGMRSQISQQWLAQATGIHCPRVRGGYKAMRRFLLDQIEQNSPICRPVVIGGRTGVGKTRLLSDCAAVIDLERLAHHRGSAFGHHPQPQPTQIDFENALSITLLKQVNAGNAPFAIEDESRNIGSRHVPAVLFARMEQAPLVLLEASDEHRVDITLQEYVHDSLAAFRARSGEDQGFQDWADYLLGSIDRIRRRLGGERHSAVRKLMRAAIERHATHNETEAHRAWIRRLLVDYYDDMYSYQLSKKAERIVFRGDRDAVLQYLQQNHLRDLPQS